MPSDSMGTRVYSSGSGTAESASSRDSFFALLRCLSLYSSRDAAARSASGFHAHGAVHGGVFCAAGQLTAMLGKAAGGIGCDACIERVVFTAQ